MARIDADPALLDRVANELDKIASNMDIQSRSLAIAGNEVAAVWKSRYTGQYLDSSNITEKKITNASEDVRNAASTLRRIAAEIRRVEREIQSQMSGSAGGGGGGGSF